jgi:hypothetical protein
MKEHLFSHLIATWNYYFKYLTVLVFCLFILSASFARTFTFSPSEQNARYTDSSNWLNGQYPGLDILNADTVIIKANSNYNTCFIDSNIRLSGYCFIDSGVNLIIPANVVFLAVDLTGDFTKPPRGGTIRSHYSSSVFIIGHLELLASNSVFDGNVNVLGYLTLETVDFSFYRVGQSFEVKGKLLIKGLFFFRLSDIKCKEIAVEPSGIIRGGNGYGFGPSVLKVEKLSNAGKIDLTENVIEIYVELINYGELICGGFSSGRSIAFNKGSIHVNDIYNSFILFGIYGDFINAGFIRIESNLNRLCEIRGTLINSGNLDVWVGERSSLTPVVKISGTFINKKIMTVHAGGFESVGDVSNLGTLDVTGKTSITYGSFNNKGLLNLFIPSYTESNLITCSFLNAGSLLNAGMLEIGDKFVQAGFFDVRPH